jgi:hypothetical protein
MAMQQYNLSNDTLKALERLRIQQRAVGNERTNQEQTNELYAAGLAPLYSREMQNAQFNRSASLDERRLNLEDEKYRGQQKAQTYSTLASIPSNLAMIEMVTKGKAGEPGWVKGAYNKASDWVSGTPKEQQPVSTTAPIQASTTASSAPVIEGGIAYAPQSASASYAPAVGVTAESGPVIESGIAYSPASYAAEGAAGSQAGATTGAGITAYSGPAAGAAAAGYVGSSVAKNEAFSKLPYTGGRKERSVMGGALAGAGAGAAIGSMAGGVGAIPGAIVGFVVGGVVGYAGKNG